LDDEDIRNASLFHGKKLSSVMLFYEFKENMQLIDEMRRRVKGRLKN
jgi:hypothetical protein